MWEASKVRGKAQLVASFEARWTVGAGLCAGRSWFGHPGPICPPQHEERKKKGGFECLRGRQIKLVADVPVVN